MAASALSILLGRMAANNMGEKYDLPNFGYETTSADTSSFSEALSELDKLKANQAQPVVAQPDTVQQKPIASASPAPQSRGESNWLRETAAAIAPYAFGAVGALQGAAHAAGQYIPGAKSVAEPIESFFAGANIGSRLLETADTGFSKVFNTPKVFQPYGNQEIVTKEGGINASGVAYALGDLGSAVALMATGAGAAQGWAQAAKYAPMLTKVGEAVPIISKIPYIGEILGAQTIAGALGTGIGTGAHTALLEADDALEGKKSLGNFLGRVAGSTAAGTMYGGGANPMASLGKKVVGETLINVGGGAIERLPELLMNDIPLLPKSVVYTALEEKLKKAAASGDSTQLAQAQGELDATSRYAGMQWHDGIGSVMNSYLGSVAVQGATGAILPAFVHGAGKLARKPKVPVAPGVATEQAAQAATAQSAETVNASEEILNNLKTAEAAAREEELDNTINTFVSKHVKTRAEREELGLGVTRDEILTNIKQAMERDPNLEQGLMNSLYDGDVAGVKGFIRSVADNHAAQAQPVAPEQAVEAQVTPEQHYADAAEEMQMPRPEAEPQPQLKLSPLKQQAYDILNTEENFQNWSNTGKEDDRPNFLENLRFIVNGLDEAKTLGTVDDVKDYLSTHKASMNKDLKEQVAPLLHESMRLRMDQAPQTTTHPAPQALLDQLDALKVAAAEAKAKRAADIAAERDEELSGKVAQFYLGEANTPEKQAQLGLGKNRQEVKATIVAAIEKDPLVEQTLDAAIDSGSPVGALELKQHINAALSGEDVNRIQYHPEIENMNDVSRWHYYGVPPQGMDGLTEAEISHALGGVPLHPEAVYERPVTPDMEVRYDANTRSTYQRAPKLLERDEVGNLLPTEKGQEVPMVIGGPTTVFFNDKQVPAHYVAVPASYTQPTHKYGDTNYANFIENPKDKRGQAAKDDIDIIRGKYNPEFAVSTDKTAFEGIPVASTRLESIQGSTRQNVQKMLTPEQYEANRQIAIKNAKAFGMDSPEQLAVLETMPEFSLQRVIDGSDEELTAIAKIGQPAAAHADTAADKSRGRLALLDPDNKFAGNNVRNAFDAISEIMSHPDNAEKTLTDVLSNERLRDRVAKELTDNPTALRYYIGGVGAKEGRENLIYDLKNLLFGNSVDTIDNLESLKAINQAVDGSLGQLLSLKDDQILDDLRTAIMELHTKTRENSNQDLKSYFSNLDIYGNSLADKYAGNPNVESLMRFFTERPPSQRRLKDLLLKYQEARTGTEATIFEPGVPAMDSPAALKAAMDDIAAKTPKQVKAEIANIVKNGVASNSPGLLSLTGAFLLPDNDEPVFAGGTMTNRDMRTVLQILGVAGLATSPVAMTMIRKLESVLPREVDELAAARVIKPRDTNVINVPLTDRQIKAVIKPKFGEYKVPFTPDQITPYDAQNLAGKISAAGLTDEAYAYYHAFLDGIFEPDAAHRFRFPKQEFAAQGFLPPDSGLYDDLIDAHALLNEGKITQEVYDGMVEKRYADILEKYRTEAEEDLRFTEQGNDEIEYWGSTLLLRNAMDGRYPMSEAMQKMVISALDETQPAYRAIAERISNSLQGLVVLKSGKRDTNFETDLIPKLHALLNGEEIELTRFVLNKGQNAGEPSALGRLMLSALDVNHTEEANWKDVLDGILQNDFSAFRDEFRVKVLRDKRGNRKYKVSFGENLTQAMKEDYRHVLKNMRAHDWREGYIETGTLQRNESIDGMPVDSYGPDISDQQKQGLINDMTETGQGEIIAPFSQESKDARKAAKLAGQRDYAYLAQQARSTKDIPKIEKAISETEDVKTALYKQIAGLKEINAKQLAQVKGEQKAWDAMIDNGVENEQWDDIIGLHKTMKPHQQEPFLAYIDMHIQNAELNKRLAAINEPLPERTNTRPYSGTLSSSLFPIAPGNWKYAKSALKYTAPSLFNAMAGYVTASIATDENSRPLGMSRDEFRAYVAASGFIIGLPHLRTYIVSKVHGTTFSAAMDTLVRGYNLPAKMEMQQTAERKTKEILMERFEAALKQKGLPQKEFDKQLAEGFKLIRNNLDFEREPEYALQYKALEKLREKVEQGFSEGLFRKHTIGITGKGFLDKIGHEYTQKLVKAEIAMEEIGRLHNEKIVQLDKDFRAKYSDDDINKAVVAAHDYDWELSEIAANGKLSEKQKKFLIYKKTLELEQKHFSKGGKEAFNELQKMLSESRKIQVEATSVRLFGMRLEELPEQISKFNDQLEMLKRSASVTKQAIANTDRSTKDGMTTFNALVSQLESNSKQRAGIETAKKQYEYLVGLPARSDLYHYLPRWFDQDGRVKYKVQSLNAKGEKVMHLYKKFKSEGAAEKWIIDFEAKRRDPNSKYYGMPRPERLPDTKAARDMKGGGNMRMKVEDIVRIAYGHGTSNLAALGAAREEIVEALQQMPIFVNLKQPEREALTKQMETMVSSHDLRSVLYNIWGPKIPHLEKRKNISGYEPVEDMSVFMKGTATAKDYKAVRDFVFGGMNRTVTKSRQDLSKAAIRDEMISQKQFLMDNGMAHTQYFDWLTRNIAEGISGNQYGNLSSRAIKAGNTVKTIVGGSKLMFNPVHGAKNLITGTLSTLTEASMSKGVLRGGATMLSSAKDLATGNRFSSPQIKEVYKRLLDAGVGETQFMNSLLDKEISNKKWQNKMYLISSKTEEYNNKLAALTHAKIALNNGATIDEAVQFALHGRQRTQYSYNPWDSTILERKIKSAPGGLGIVATTLMSSAFRATEHAASIYYRALKNDKHGASAALAFVLGASALTGLYGTPMIGDTLRGIEWLEKMANNNPDETKLTKENSKERWQRMLGDIAERLGAKRQVGENLVRDIYYGLSSTSSNVNLSADNTLTGMLNPVVGTSLNTLVAAAQAVQGTKAWGDVGMNAIKEVTQLNRGFRAGMQLAAGHKLDNKLNQVSDLPFTPKDAAKEFLFGRSLKSAEAVQTGMTGGSAINDEYSAQKYVQGIYSIPNLKVGHERGKKAGQQLEELISQAPQLRTNIIKQYEKTRPERLENIEKVKQWVKQHPEISNWIDRAGGTEIAGNLRQGFGKAVERQVEKYYEGVAAKAVLGAKAKFHPDKGTPDQIAIEHGKKQGAALAKKLGKQAEWRELLKSGKL